MGDNAHGKSNLLEAVYYLETFRSFRGARDRQLIAFGYPFFRIEGELTSPEPDRGGTRVAAAYERSTARKKVVVDGVEVERLGDGIGHVGAVIFSPADITLVSSGPSERRRFLDILLSLNARGYLDHLQRYRQALERRNVALRRGEPPAAVSPWNAPLLRHGSAVTELRLDWVRTYERSFRATYEAVSGGASAWMEYRCSFELPNSPPSAGMAEESPGVFVAAGPGRGEVAEAFEDALLRSAERERRRGWTVVGPHRDDVFIGLGSPEEGLDLRQFGSGGQRRTAALALRLVEGETIRQVRKRAPIILMDDVFAELDEGRSERLLSLLDEQAIGQVLLTAPKDADIRLRADTLPRWRIRSGEVST